jgi:hypothetical protein
LKIAFFIVTLLLVLVACQTEEGIYDSLSEDEKAVVRARGTQECLNKSTLLFKSWKTTSNEIFTSSSYQRGNGFYYLQKKAGADERSIDIQIWKQTSTDIYFYIKDNRASSNYFLRLSKSVNETMIDHLLEAHCARSSRLYVTSSVSGSSATFTYEHEYAGDPTDEQYSDVYPLSFSYPALFAAYQIQRTVKQLDDDDRQVGSAVSYTSSLTSKSVTFSSDNYSDYTQKFCIPAVDATTSRYQFTDRRSQEGYFINLDDTTQCLTNYAAAQAAGWNL